MDPDAQLEVQDGSGMYEGDVAMVRDAPGEGARGAYCLTRSESSQRPRSAVERHRPAPARSAIGRLPAHPLANAGRPQLDGVPTSYYADTPTRWSGLGGRFTQLQRDDGG